MSLTPAQAGMEPVAPPPPLSCPRCGEALAAGQEWCLRCGDPALTVIAATPPWRRPIIAILALTAIALGVLTAAFIGLTNDDPPPPRTITTTTTLAPGASPPPGVATVPTTPVAPATTVTTPATTTTPTTTPTTSTTTAGGAQG